MTYIKALAAQLITLCENYKSRHGSIAITHFETGAMYAVKAATAGETVSMLAVKTASAGK